MFTSSQDRLSKIAILGKLATYFITFPFNLVNMIFFERDRYTIPIAIFLAYMALPY